VKERDLIEQIRRLAGSGSADLLQGIGDDCAVIEKTAETVLLLTMDTLIESIHFDCSWHPPEKLGRKAVAVNVSDIAAMGGKPVFALLSLGLPAGFDEQWLAGFSSGLTAACREYDCLLIGGDTVCSPDRIALTLTVIGEMKKEQVLYRHGARPGDTVWVSGPLGCAAAGLDLFRSGEIPDIPELQPLLEAHLDPRARAELAVLLAQSGLVHAMMDLSDGLAMDLSHLCDQSKVGARIMAARLPDYSKLTAAADFLKQNPLDWMISGGEDYELLFTAAPADSEKLLKLITPYDYGIYPVGTIVREQGVSLIRDPGTKGYGHERNISYQGYDHFTTS
jgi:thiamine-monophosphate kinase